MPCHPIPNGIICMTDGPYEYKGFTFEWHPYFGPIRLRKDGYQAERQGRRFYEAVEEWRKMREKEVG